MRPLLFQLPLPALRLTLWPALVGLAAVVALLTFFAFRRAPAADRRGFALPGVLVAGLLALSVAYRDRALVVGPIEVGGFGAMLALALALGAWLTLRATQRQGMPHMDSASVCVAAAVSGIVGARVGYALLHPSELSSVLGVLAFFDGGLVAHGALVFGVAGAFIAARRRGLSPLAWLDAASAGFAVGVALTRIGCWLEGCDFGKTLGASAPRFLARLGTFPAGSHAWVEQVSTQVISASAPSALPVHPAQLYEAVGALGLALLVRRVERSKSRAGVAALAALAGYVVLRVLVDSLRVPSREVWLGRLLLALGLVLAVAVFVQTRRSAERRT